VLPDHAQDRPSFVAGLADDHRDRTIVHTVIQLAHGLGMDVVAEGVER
jgi:EAL domain-containing protein (putative c-di-GMP-specific phosphodiesterase class I)